jgi:hypothetical protein
MQAASWLEHDARVSPNTNTPIPSVRRHGTIELAAIVHPPELQHSRQGCSRAPADADTGPGREGPRGDAVRRLAHGRTADCPHWGARRGDPRAHRRISTTTSTITLDTHLGARKTGRRTFPLDDGSLRELAGRSSRGEEPLCSTSRVSSDASRPLIGGCATRVSELACRIHPAGAAPHGRGSAPAREGPGTAAATLTGHSVQVMLRLGQSFATGSRPHRHDTVIRRSTPSVNLEHRGRHHMRRIFARSRRRQHRTRGPHPARHRGHLRGRLSLHVPCRHRAS